MNMNEFTDGMKQIGAALQGDFQQEFCAYLWNKFKDLPPPIWKRTVELLCRVDKQARQVVAADFFRCVNMAREEEHYKAKGKRHGKEIGEPVPFSRICEIFKDGFWGEQAQRELKNRTSEDRKP